MTSAKCCYLADWKGASGRESRTRRLVTCPFWISESGPRLKQILLVPGPRLPCHRNNIDRTTSIGQIRSLPLLQV